MSFLTGTVSLGNGVSSGSVIFSPAFAGVPPLVIPVVQNNSNPLDPTILLLNATSYSVTAAGFDFELDGSTNTANYVLTWIAGSPDILFAAITAVGRRLTDWPKFTGTPADHDIIPFAQVSPIARSLGINWSVFKTYFIRKLAAVPGGPTVTDGDLNAMTADANYLYVRISGGTARIPLSTTAWTISDAAKKRLVSTHTCTATQAQTVLFGVTFAGIPKIIGPTLRNVVAGPKAVYHGIVTDVTATGFEYTLNAAIGSAGEANNYFLDYEAIY